MKSITKAVFILTLFSVISRILGFVFRIYLSHSIGEEGIAIYQISMSLFFVFLTFVSSGIPSILSRQIARYNAKKEYHKIHNIISSSLFIVALIDACVILFLLAFRNLFQMFQFISIIVKINFNNIKSYKSIV